SYFCSTTHPQGARPPQLVDKCIGSRIHIVMKSDKEIVGTLLGFDDFVSILFKSDACCPEITPEGRRITKLDQILLNGNNITMVRHISCFRYFDLLLTVSSKSSL
uniref:U6 snRNA-associated Sm-like protein LSm5 n=1 Tax=Ornithorhynchus anatinus TaxID=9258 RepID=A0A6I8NTE5_ORNAN